MDELTNWYGHKERKEGDLSVSLKQDDGAHLVITGGEPLLKGFQPAVRELITSPNSEVFVAEIENEILASGYAKIKTDRHYLKHEKQGYLGFMYVSEDHRGKQLNKHIIDALLQWCKSRNIFEIRLDVYDDNFPALSAYQKVGFKKHMMNMRLDIEN